MDGSLLRLGRHVVSGGAANFTSIARLDTDIAWETEDHFPEQEQSPQAIINDFGPGTNLAVLPAVDKGFEAWSYVAGAFAMNVAVWGMLCAANACSLTDTIYGASRGLSSFSKPICQRGLHRSIRIHL